MKWNNSFALGIEEIDAQHKKIFERLLAIENAVTKRDPWHILRFQLDELALLHEVPSRGRGGDAGNHSLSRPVRASGIACEGS
jgi:hypothetical protein